MFFNLMLRPQPRSTLFPYTTLFRSLFCVGRVAGHFQPVFRLALAFVVRVRRDVREIKEERMLPLVSDEVERRAREPVDRKSTRLNSSHRCISYAVFCLKKKRTNQHL